MISDTATEQVFGSSGGGFLAALVINHPALPSPLRFIDNNVNITSTCDGTGAQLYIAYPFKLTLPSDKDQSPPAAKLQIDNIDRQIAETVRTIVDPPTVAIFVVRLDDPNTVEVKLPLFNLRNVDWDFGQLSGDLTIDDITKEPFPQRSYTPAEYPGLF